MNTMVTTEELSELTGYTKGAIHMKVKKGVWTRNEHYFKAPDGKLIFVVEMVYQCFKENSKRVLKQSKAAMSSTLLWGISVIGKPSLPHKIRPH